MAKTYHKLKDFTKAEFICDQVHQFEDNYARAEPQIYWKYAVKAQYIKAKQMQVSMEFRKAKFFLEQEAKPILIILIDKFQTDKKDAESKVLLDNKYSFEYRKMYAAYERRFLFFPEAIEQLKSILTDELAFYK